MLWNEKKDVQVKYGALCMNFNCTSIFFCCSTDVGQTDSIMEMGFGVTTVADFQQKKVFLTTGFDMDVLFLIFIQFFAGMDGIVQSI